VPDPPTELFGAAAGHGEGKPTATAIAESTDLLTFLEAALGPAGQPAG
jgi:prolyl oligopeptidase PreP (S9A serine peptidase family)